ncbi:MAG: DNA-binding response regulator [Bacteroidetes bacterium GWF2_38_335]|nr:MAG: DNA-binding response regulator [Bacteroidetes bacterium GWF2_38_335]OFY79276.1 MAG: DNA-binding response regulator [Bacteroidetes bacterium RIFOXYA12_FULL_38_20]HBS86450.1 DNA-binding response regulator [Bacteroidales bacterium]
MNKVKCLIVDDEPLAREQIEIYVTKTSFLELRGTCKSVFEVIEIMENEKIDLIFLDIQMPEFTGIEFSRNISNEVKIILVTAFVDYAVEGYKVNAMDYLLKPVDYDEFLSAAYKAKIWCDMVNNKKDISVQVNNDYLFIKTAYKYIKVDLNKILYFEGLKDYVKTIVDYQSNSIMTISSLKAIENVLPKDKFMRVHRSFIVALGKIKMIDKGQIIINEKQIPVSDQYKDKLMQFITKHMV